MYGSGSPRYGAGYKNVSTETLNRAASAFASVFEIARSPRRIFDKRSSDGGKGLARDTRVRWALEETS